MSETLTGYCPPLVSETTKIKTPDDNSAFEKWYQLRDLYRLRAVYSNLPAEDRISAPEEPQATVFASGSISFNYDMERLDILHFKLGMRQGQRLAHDPAMERARYERATSDEEKQAVKQGVVTNMEKTLYERAFTSQSTVMYYQDDEGRIFHPNFPGEAFDVVLQRGLKYSKRNGFVDCERETAEFAGWKEAMAVLFDPKTPLESKAVSISGRGQKKGTAFTDNFVDIFTKTIDPVTNKVVVAMTRFASDTSYEEYKKIATKLDNNYFDSGKTKTNEELEIYFKRHPIFLNSTIDSRDARQIFNQEFTKQKRATEEESTRHYLEECKLCILDYAETVCAKFFDPESVKLSFNTVINKFDYLRKGLVKAISRIASGISEFGRKAVSVLNTVWEDKNYYGRMKVEEIMVGCGLSGGFSLGGIARTIRGLISRGIIGVGIAMGLSESDSMGSLYFSCPACGAINKRPREGILDVCQNEACPNPTAGACGSAGKEGEEQKEESKIIAFPAPATQPTSSKELPKAA